MKEYSVRKMKEALQDSQHEEIQKYAMKYIVSNEECNTTAKIETKLKAKFGKTYEENPF